MRIYQSIKEVNSEIRRDLKEMGVEYNSATVQDQTLEGDEARTLELCPYVYTLVVNNADDMRAEILALVRDGNPDKAKWMEYEMLERNSAYSLHEDERNPGYAWRHYEKFWGQFLHDGKFSYQYAERIGDQMIPVVSELKKNPNSRQAIMSIYRPEDLANRGGKARVPCSLQYHFLVREGQLHMMYFQRSCDFAKFFLPDVYFAIGMGAEIADRLGIPFRRLVHTISSLHVFYSDVLEVF